MTQLTPEQIAFFSGAGIFRLRSTEKMRERFDDFAEEFQQEFDAEPTDEIFDLVLAIKADKDTARKEKAKAKILADANKPLVGGYDDLSHTIDVLPHGRYVFTCAQNNTEINKPFFDALQRYCELMGAELIIGKTTYNKAGFQQPALDYSGKEVYYVKEVEPYLREGHINFADFAHFLADANVIPTAKNPLTGFDGATPNGVNVIIPHVKIALKVSAALKGAKTKIVCSTGAITKPNYILRKAGAVASLEHNIGAVFIDTQARELRHVELMQGCNGFYDDALYFTAKGMDRIPNCVEALQFGDIHAEKMEAANLQQAIAMVEKYQPQNIILHDVLDFSSRNHHNVKDCTFIFAQEMKGNSVKNDLQSVANVLNQIGKAALGQIHIVESNHDLAINTWLKNMDFKTDPTNALVYLDCMKALYENIAAGGGSFNMLAYAMTQYGLQIENINFHETDESLVIAGIEMGNHGHNGVNGSRGSPMQFRALGVKMNTGHTHSPSIYGGVYTAGVKASMNMGYNLGASSWANCDIITYKNGQRQLIFA